MGSAAVVGGSKRFDLHRGLVAEAAWSLAPLVVTGLLAIGASGLVAWAMGRLFGKAFVAGDVPGVTYTRARCADLFEYAHGARSCFEAAAFHHYDETVWYRVAAGVLGLFALSGLVWTRRRFRWRLAASAGRLPAAFPATVGVTAFGLAGLALLADGTNRLAQGVDTGGGASLSAAVVALGVALACGIVLYRTLLRPARTPP